LVLLCDGEGWGLWVVVVGGCGVLMLWLVVFVGEWLLLRCVDFIDFFFVGVFLVILLCY